MRRGEGNGRDGCPPARTVLEALREGVLVLGPGGRVRYLNRSAAALLGKARPEVVGRHWREVLPVGDEAGDALESCLAETSGTGTERTPRRRVRLEHGVEVEVDVVALPDPRDETRLLLLEDVSGEAEAERARQEFLYMIVHDLNTPLQSIVGFAELLLMERSGALDDTQRDFLRRIEAGGWQMTELVRHILDVTQLESGAVELDREMVDPFPLVQRALESLGEGGADPARVVNDVPPDLPPVDGDPKQLGRALETVLRRALEVSEPATRVRVRSETDESARLLRLHVEDEAPSPEEADTRHLFDEVWTVRRARDAATRRRALGLAIARLVVEGHGGSVAASTLPGGTGTRVTLALPLADGGT